jgi:putative tricarboxylic transport membrane protein
MVVLNLPLIGIWVRLLTVPYRFVYPSILVFCCVGVYTVNNTTFDVLMTAGFGLLVYIFIKLGCAGAPLLLLGFVLGPMTEENFRPSLLLSRGDFSVFFTRPLSLALLIATAALIVIVALPSIKSKREEAFQEE